MRPSGFVALRLFFVAAAFLPAVKPQSPIPANLYLLRISVTDDAGRPAAEAEVRLDGIVIGITDADGQYCLGRKPGVVGSHEVSVSLSGFKTAARPVRIPDADTPGIELAFRLARDRGGRFDGVQRGSGKPNYSTVQVFYVTDRKDTASSDPGLRYANERAAGGAVAHGVCEVSIPATHVEGERETPSWIHLEFRPDPGKHVLLRGVEALETTRFYERVAATVASSRSKEVVVFIHGYKVSFENAARQAAQMAYDLHFDGAPIMYSWPSKDSIFAYTEDEDTVQWTMFHLRDFLQELAQRAHASKIHVVAHSMGNRALAPALQLIAAKQRPGAKPLFHQIILAAPDIGAETLEQFAREIRPVVSRITLYASGNDDALLLSRYIHGAVRAGQKGTYLLVSPGIDTVDASGVRTDFLGHRYFSNSGTILDDIQKLLTKGAPPELRNLVPAVLANLKYWIVPNSQVPQTAAVEYH